jgi:hypothetical protein
MHAASIDFARGGNRRLFASLHNRQWVEHDRRSQSPTATLKRQEHDVAGVMRALLLSSMCMASPAVMAAPAAPLGCFARTYDAAHLRDHRGQQVRRLWLRLETSRYEAGKIEFGLTVWLRGQPQAWLAGGRCEPDPIELRCQPDTDGASGLLITRAGRNLRLSNPGKLKIFDDVTGPDLNDRLLSGPDHSTFLLSPAPDATCKDTRP